MSYIVNNGKRIVNNGGSLSINTTAPRNGLIGEWLFNGNPNDTSDSGNNGTLINSPSLTTDRKNIPNKSYEFLYTNEQYIDMGNNSILQPVNAISISVWIYLYRIDGWMGLVTTNTLTSWSNTPYFLWMDAAKSCVELGITTGSTLKRLKSIDYPVQLYTWTHIVGVYDGSKMMIYKDNQLASQLNVSGNISYSNFNSLKVGAIQQYSYMDGKADALRIYDRALSKNEVTQLYYNYV